MDKLTVGILIVFATLLALPLYADGPVQVADSSVFIKVKATYYTPTGKKDGWSSCSGVFITPSAILTAAHCLSKPELTKQMWFSYQGKSYRFTPWYSDERRDLAILVARDIRGTPAKLDPILTVGEDVWAYGFPLRIPGILTKGIVSNPRIVSYDDKVAEIFFDSMIFPGSSGGGLFNKHGHLVGITVKTTSFARGAAGLGIAVSMEEIHAFIRDATSFRRRG